MVNQARAFEEFFAQVADTLGVDRSKLFLVTEMRGHGAPTAGPGDPRNGLLERKEITFAPGKSVSLPGASYDSIGSRHIEYQIMHRKGSETTPISELLYAWQLHPLPGNCGACVNRWVRIGGPKPWTPALLEAGLRLRARIARANSYGIMVVTTGNSFAGGERFDLFQKVYEGVGRGPLKLGVLDLRTMVGA